MAPWSKWQLITRKNTRGTRRKLRDRGWCHGNHDCHSCYFSGALSIATIPVNIRDVEDQEDRVWSMKEHKTDAHREQTGEASRNLRQLTLKKASTMWHSPSSHHYQSILINVCLIWTTPLTSRHHAYSLVEELTSADALVGSSPDSIGRTEGACPQHSMKPNTGLVRWLTG